jgi:hypothetical protein
MISENRRITQLVDFETPKGLIHHKDAVEITNKGKFLN